MGSILDRPELAGTFLDDLDDDLELFFANNQLNTDIRRFLLKPTGDNRDTFSTGQTQCTAELSGLAQTVSIEHARLRNRYTLVWLNANV